jgi:hypothetical protein
MNISDNGTRSVIYNPYDLIFEVRNYVQGTQSEWYYSQAAEITVVGEETDPEVTVIHHSLAVSITDKANDGYAVEGNPIDNSSYYMKIGASCRAFMLFTNVTVPAGAIIEYAHLKWRSYSDDTSSCDVTICLRNIANAVVPSDSADLFSFGLTTGVGQKVQSHSNGILYESFDFMSELQSVIDLSGWASGNSVLVVIKDNASEKYGERQLTTHDYGSTFGGSPELHIGYTT